MEKQIVKNEIIPINTFIKKNLITSTFYMLYGKRNASRIFF
jgi:hypothetical protein